MRLLALVLTFLICLNDVWCVDDKESTKDFAQIVGLWEVTAGRRVSPDTSLEFSKVGTFKVLRRQGPGITKDNKTIDAKTVTVAEGRYKIEASQLIMTAKVDGEEKTEKYVIKSLTDKLLITVRNDGDVTHYKKIAVAPASPSEQSEAVKALEKLGGKITVDETQTSRPVVEISLNATNASDMDLKDLKQLKSLQKLNISRTKITDAGLKEIKDLKALHTLLLGGTAISNAGLKDVAELTNLRNLLLGGTRVTDAGLKELKKLKSLQMLGLDGTQVTDAGLKELKDFASLQVLVLQGTRITDAGVKDLKDLKNLQVLYLGNTAVTEAAEKELKASLPGIRINR